VKKVSIGRLGLVLRLAGRGQEERLAQRVLDRIVDAVLEDLADATTASSGATTITA
jgi:hypothetical protein